MPPLLIHVVDRLCHELYSDCESFPHTFTAQIFFETLRYRAYEYRREIRNSSYSFAIRQ